MTEKIGRRGFLMVAAAGAAGVAGLQLVHKADASESVKGEHQWAMVIDQNKCIGCGYCTLACQAHNDVSPEIHGIPSLDSRQVGDKTVYLPRPCMHCDKAPCVDVCPGEGLLLPGRRHRDDGL